MPRRAATTCWGVVLGLGLMLPVGARQTPPAGQKVPVQPPYDVAWTTNFEALGPLRLTLTPTVVVVAGQRTPVQARHAADGTLAWAAEFTASGAVAAGNGLVFIPTTSTLHALDEVSGREQWQVAIPGGSPGLSWTSGGLIVPSGEDVQALRITDAGVAWRQPLDAPASATATIAGARVFVPTADGTLLALDLATGAVLWRIRTGSPAGPITVLNDTVYFATADGTVAAVRATDGERSWQYPTHTRLVGGVEVDAAHAYAAFIDNTVRAFDARIGNDRWRTRLDSRPVQPLTWLAGRPMVALANGAVLTLDPASGRAERLVTPAGTTAVNVTTLESVTATSDGDRLYTLTWANERSYALIGLSRAASPVTGETRRY